MKKIVLVVISFFFSIAIVNAQLSPGSNFNLADSLLAVNNTQDNAKKIDILFKIGLKYAFSQGDTAIKYLKLAEDIAIKSKNERSLFKVYLYIAAIYNQTLGNYPLGLHFATEQLKLGQKLNLPDSVMKDAYYNLTFSYAYLKNKDLAFKYLDLRWPISNRNKAKLGSGESNLAKVYNILENNDSALLYNSLSVQANEKKAYEKRWSAPYVVQGDIYRSLKKYDSAIIYYKLSIPLAIKAFFYKDFIES